MKVIDPLQRQPKFGRKILTDIRNILIVIISERSGKLPLGREVMVGPDNHIALYIGLKDLVLGRSAAENATQEDLPGPAIVDRPGQLKLIDPLIVGCDLSLKVKG
jgi:hypothetical protein